MNPSRSTFAARFFASLALCLGITCSVSPEVTFDTGTDFQLVLSARQLAVAQGGQGSAGVQVNWLGNCGCPDVQLSVTGAPAGLDARFDANPTPYGTTLFITASNQLPAGTYHLVVTGVRGTLQRSQPLDVQVAAPTPDFSVILNPAFLAIGQGGSGTMGIDIQRTGGFAEAINLSLAGAPAGVTASFSGTPVGAQYPVLPSQATLLLNVSASAPVGSHVLTVNASASSRLRSASFILSIQPVGDFSLSLAPVSLTTSAGTGSAGPVAIALTRAPGFVSSVSFTLEGAPAGCSGSFTPANTTGSTASLALTLAGVAPGTYPMTVRGSAGSISHSATLLLTITIPPQDFALPSLSVQAPAGGTGTAGIVITPINGFSGTVTLSASGLPAGVTVSFNPNPATPAGGSTLNVSVPAAVAPGTYTGSLRGVSGSLDHGAVLTLVVNPLADFSLALSPSANLSIQVPRIGPNPGTVAVLVQPVGAFNGAVTLSAENLPAGVLAAFNPNPATSTSTLTLEVGSNATPGSYTVTVRGVSGALNHTTILNLTLTSPPNVTVTLSPASGGTSIPASGTGTVTTTVNLVPVNGFTGNVALGTKGLPAGVSSSFSPNPSAVPGSSILTLAVTPAATAGSWTFQIEAVQGTMTVQADYTLTLSAPAAPDFTVTPQIPAVTEQPGTTGSLGITVTSVNGFAGTVIMSLQNAPAGINSLFSPVPVIVPAGGSTSTNLWLNTAASTVGGVYSTLVRGTSGALVRDASLQITVSDFTLAAVPGSFTYATGAGIAGGGSINISRLFGLTGSISLSATLPGFTFSFSPSSTTGNSSGFSFIGPALAPAPPGVYTATVTGNRGSFSRTTPVTISVRGFLLTAMPSELSGTGAGVPVQITATPIAGTPGPVTLSLGPAMWTGAFAPNPVAMGSASTMTLSLIGTPSIGPNSLNVNGTAGTYTASRTVIFNYQFSPDFYIHVTNTGGATLSVVTLNAGETRNLRVLLNPVSGYTGIPVLTLSGAQAGLTAAFTPASVSVGTPSTLTLAADSALAPGTYFVDVVATATPLVRKATLLVIVQ